MLRLALPAIVLIYATGCCCCGGGGSSSSSSDKSSWREALEEKAAEAITEKVLEAALDAEDLDIDAEAGTISMKTEEGSFVLNAGEDGATVDLLTAEGEEVHMTAGTAGSLPDSFPFAVPAGSDLAFTNSTTADGKQTVMVMMTHPSIKSKDAVVAHWEAQLSKLGKVTKTELNQADTQAVMLTLDNGTAAVVAIAEGQLSSTVTAAY